MICENIFNLKPKRSDRRKVWNQQSMLP